MTRMMISHFNWLMLSVRRTTSCSRLFSTGVSFLFLFLYPFFTCVAHRVKCFASCFTCRFGAVSVSLRLFRVACWFFCSHFSVSFVSILTRRVTFNHSISFQSDNPWRPCRPLPTLTKKRQPGGIRARSPILHPLDILC